VRGEGGVLGVGGLCRMVWKSTYDSVECG